jgi:hypothetical protein
MTEEKSMVSFENQAVRRHFDETEERWYFSVVDVVAVLTGSGNPRDYWFKMKTRVQSEDGIELSTICRQLKLQSSDREKGGKIAKHARQELEAKTGKSVVTGENFLSPPKKKEQIESDRAEDR